jgi:hypothetical protein
LRFGEAISYISGYLSIPFFSFLASPVHVSITTIAMLLEVKVGFNRDNTGGYRDDSSEIGTHFGAVHLDSIGNDVRHMA